MDQPPKTVELSVNTIRVLLFGDETIEGISPQSKNIGDTAKVIIRSFALGKCLVAIDPTEEFFHIEFFEKDSQKWAEIWLAFEWKESNARLLRVRQASQAARETKEKTDSRLSKIKAKLVAKGLDSRPGYVEHLARQILDNYRQGDFTQALKVLDLVELLLEFDREDKEGK